MLGGQTMVRYSIIVTGRVQGVGFRYFLQLIAYRLNLTGWCKNLMDGTTVEIEVQGLDKNISLFISSIKTGNNFSKVDNINSSTLPIIDAEKKFVIKY
jgi:acylphosphatase